MNRVTFNQAWYVKLGKGGIWEKDSLESNKLRVGWPTDLLPAIREKRWDDIRDIVKRAMPRGGGTHDFNMLKVFVESGPDDLWITFHGSKLWWCRISGELKKDKTSMYKAVDGQWSDRDIEDTLLMTDNISGRLLRVSGYRATICKVKYADDLRRLINVEVSEEYKAAEKALNDLVEQVESAIRRLHWKDFELLVDLLFRSAGWRRVSVLGKTAKFTDLNLEEPITCEKYQVQVKSAASLEEFEFYRDQFNDSLYRRMYFVVHSPEKSLQAAQDTDKIHLLFANRLARMVVDAGLVKWLMEKIR